VEQVTAALELVREFDAVTLDLEALVERIIGPGVRELPLVLEPQRPQRQRSDLKPMARAAHELKFAPPAHGSRLVVMILNSVRRFLARPSSVSLGALGSLWPAPRVSSRSSPIPPSTRYCLTLSARALDSSRL